MSLLKHTRKVRTKLYWWAKFLGDLNAILSGRFWHRYKQRTAGKYSRRALNKVIKLPKRK